MKTRVDFENEKNIICKPPSDSRLTIFGDQVVIFPNDRVHAQRVKFRPIEVHYETPGEEPYIKHRCPICSSVMNTSIYTPLKKFSIPSHSENCPICGINLFWED